MSNFDFSNLSSNNNNDDKDFVTKIKEIKEKRIKKKL